MRVHLVDDLRQFAKPAALRIMRFWGASDRTARDSALVAAAVLLFLVIAQLPAGAVDSAAPTAPVLVAEPNSGPASVLAAVREATAKYLDVDRARADGFVQISGMEARHGIHFMNVNAQLLSLLSRGVNLSSPPMLIYAQTPGGGVQLAAVEYAVTNRPTNQFPGARWFEHESSCHYRDYRDLPSPTAAGCPKVHPETGAEFVLFHPHLWFMHVWAWYPNPVDIYAEENPYLSPFGGVHVEAHAHAQARSGTEIAYSEFNHRSSGVFLLVIAAVAFWQALRRPRSLVWPGVAAALWIAFGVYLFIRSDPEAWPWGPLGLVESLRDTEVLQHKVLTVIPIVIGLAEGLYGYGLLTRRPSLRLLSLLALAGGVGLFLHFHQGTLHLDWIYAQHVMMGLTGLAAGVGLLRSRRAEPGSKLHLLWPTFLVVMALVLLFYTEH
ncbi:MAG: hypothetical protein DME09_11875 [Candidatus Rokuibacteriota bacterium]|nr:MAG: hypothetical protein DME09_11875 [Candidatus Rokubacteria bacterium]